MIDIANDTSDYWSLVIGRSNFDFSQFQSASTGRGPLLDAWQVGSFSLLQIISISFVCVCAI